MKSESVMRKSSWDTHIKIAAVLADLGVLRRAEVTETVESRNDQIHDKFEAKVGKIIADTFEDALYSRYLDSNERLKLAIFNIVEHALTEVVHAGGGRDFDKI